MSRDFKLIIVSIIAAFILFFSIKYNLQLTHELDTLRDQHTSTSELLAETLYRAQSEALTRKGLEKRIEEIIQENTILRDDIAKLKAKPISAGTVYITLPGKTETIQGNFPSHYEYRNANGLLVAKHDYSLEQNTFTAQTFDLGLNVNIVETIDKNNNKNTYIDSTAFSSAEPNDKWPVDIIANFAYTKPKKSFQLLDPHVNLGISLTAPTLETRGSLGMSLSSIGKTRSDNVFRFANLKAEIGKDLAIGIDPIGLNITKVTSVPIIEDTWLWMGITSDIYPVPIWNATISLGSTL